MRGRWWKHVSRGSQAGMGVAADGMALTHAAKSGASAELVLRPTILFTLPGKLQQKQGGQLQEVEGRKPAKLARLSPIFHVTK